MSGEPTTVVVREACDQNGDPAGYRVDYHAGKMPAHRGALFRTLAEALASEPQLVWHPTDEDVAGDVLYVAISRRPSLLRRPRTGQRPG